MPPPTLSPDERALLQELYRYAKTHGVDTYVSPLSLAEGVGMSVGQAGSAIASLFIKDLLTLKEAQSGRLSRDGLILGSELFDD